ncbi:hypothetical protein BpHYR1_034655 [Brachionus plicatilis]|uniref:Uncharacterized protein n=1 Tax=Brachionus plicatilis TaxID=10195 RepID=A0A3M7SY82_BRAPC|nr:hypothetical protein BpHYR1_034655 [Brachionus plicatilis]
MVVLMLQIFILYFKRLLQILYKSLKIILFSDKSKDGTQSLKYRQLGLNNLDLDFFWDFKTTLFRSQFDL